MLLSIEWGNSNGLILITKESTFIVEVGVKRCNEFVHHKCFVAVRKRSFGIVLELIDGTVQASHAGSIVVGDLKEAFDNAIQRGTEMLYRDARWFLVCINCVHYFDKLHDTRNKFRHSSSDVHVTSADAVEGNNVAGANAVNLARNGDAHHEAVEGCIPCANVVGSSNVPVFRTELCI